MVRVNGRNIGNTNRSRALRERELREEIQTSARTGFDRSGVAHPNSLSRPSTAHQPRREEKLPLPPTNRFSTGIPKTEQFYPHSNDELNLRVQKINSAFRATYPGVEPSSGLMFALASNPRIPTNGLINAFPFEASDALGSTRPPYNNNNNNKKTTNKPNTNTLQSPDIDAKVLVQNIKRNKEIQNTKLGFPIANEISDVDNLFKSLGLTEPTRAINNIRDTLVDFGQGAFEFITEDASKFLQAVRHGEITVMDMGAKGALSASGIETSLRTQEDITEQSGFDPETDKLSAGIGAFDIATAGGFSAEKGTAKAVFKKVAANKYVKLGFRAAELSVLGNASRLEQEKGFERAFAENTFEMGLASVILAFEGKVRLPQAKKIIKAIPDSKFAEIITNVYDNVAVRLDEALVNERGAIGTGFTPDPDVPIPKLAENILERQRLRGKVVDASDIDPIDPAIMKQMTDVVDEIISNDPERALRIALGEESLESAALNNRLFKRLERQASEIDTPENDELLDLLARSPLTKQGTEAGQAIKALDEPGFNSPIKIIEGISRKRLDDQGRRLVEKAEQEIESLKTKIDEIVSGEGLGPGEGPGLGPGFGLGEGPGLGPLDEAGQEAIEEAVDAIKMLTGPKGGKIKGVDKYVNKLKETGKLDDADYVEIVQKKLGIEVTPEESKAVRQATRTRNREREFIEANNDELPNGHASRLDYGWSEVDLHALVAGMMDPAQGKGFFGHLSETSKRAFRQRSLRSVDGTPSSLVRGVKAVGGMTKSMRASFDNSVIGRQGLKTLLTEPKLWAKNSLRTFEDWVRAAGGADVIGEVNADIISRKNAIDGTYSISDLHVGMDIIEEEFPSHIASKIPIVGRAFKGSEAAFTAFQQRQRADIFDKYLELAESGGSLIKLTEGAAGVSRTGAELRGIGRLVNSLTGRGALVRGGGSTGVVNTVMFSPKNLKSHWDILTAHSGGLGFEQGATFAKQKAAKQLVNVYGGIGAALYVADAVLPGSVEWNSTSANFGKIRNGPDRFDVTGGMGTLPVLFARQYAALEKSSTTGNIYEYGNEGMKQTSVDALIKFFENKLSPMASAALASRTGKDPIGRETNFAEQMGTFTEAYGLKVIPKSGIIVPIMIEETFDQIDGPFGGVSMLVLAAEFLGVSSSTYIAPDDPLLLEEKTYQDFYKDMTDAEKFESRSEWRDTMKSTILKELTEQPNDGAAQAWSEYVNMYNLRSQDLDFGGVDKDGEPDGSAISPDGDYYKKTYEKDWDEAIEQLGKDFPVWKFQMDSLPDKLFER